MRLVYFPHRYAAWLLGRVAAGASLRSLKQSPCRRLVDNPLVREVAARAAGGCLTRAELEAATVRRTEIYRLGLATWGNASGAWEQGWYQTSRPGVNLLLLLNFSPRHNAAYRRRLDPQGVYPLVWTSHPHAQPPELTLAWARIDVDLSGGEALVEEIQSDWIRGFGSVWSWVSAQPSRLLKDQALRSYFRSRAADFESLERYWTRTLANHRAWWAEATLFAALRLLREELGLRRIYYHTHEGGIRRKGIFHGEPPRSIYTKLPRRFGFDLTAEAPAFLGQARSRRTRHGAGAESVKWALREMAKGGGKSSGAAGALQGHEPRRVRTEGAGVGAPARPPRESVPGRARPRAYAARRRSYPQKVWK
jgi:hypothetical protein